MIDCESFHHFLITFNFATSKYDKEFLQAELQKFEEGDYTSALANVGACLAYVNLDALFSKEEKEWYISGIQEWIDAQQNSTYVPLYKEQLKFVETNAIEHLVANSFVSYNKDRQPESNTGYISVEAAVQHPVSLKALISLSVLTIASFHVDLYIFRREVLSI